MTKIIKEQIDVVDPDWRVKWYEKCSLFGPFPDYIRNKKVTKLFELQKVKNWQVDGGYIWLEID